MRLVFILAEDCEVPFAVSESVPSDESSLMCNLRMSGAWKTFNLDAPSSSADDADYADGRVYIADHSVRKHTRSSLTYSGRSSCIQWLAPSIRSQVHDPETHC